MRNNPNHTYWSLPPVLAQSSWNSCDVLIVKRTKSISVLIFGQWLCFLTSMEFPRWQYFLFWWSDFYIKPGLKAWDIQPHPILQERERVWNGVNDQSSLHDKIYTKISKVWGPGSFWEGVAPQLCKDWSSCTWDPSLGSCVHLHLAVHLCPSSYAFYIINWQARLSVSLGSVYYSSK